MAYVKTKLYGGSFQYLNGQPMSNGWLMMYLVHDANLNLPSSQIASGVGVKLLLNTNGNLAGSPFVWTNDILTPSGTQYVVDLFNNQGLRVWAAPQYWTLASGNPIDIGAIVPNNPS